MTRNIGWRAAGGALFVAGAAAAMIAYRLPRVQAAIDQSLSYVESHSSSHWQLFCLGQILIAACGVLPASVMAIMAGALYGLAPGLGISVVCTMLGGWLAFSISRSVLRPWVERFLPPRNFVGRVDQAIAMEGWRFVCLLRISPIMPFAATSYGLGLTQIKQREFLLGTLASLPTMGAFVAIGAFGKAGMLAGEFGGGPLRWGVLALGLVTVVWAIARINEMLRRSLTAPGAATQS
jgi:uncharacterized membrane protein YdjX (TVP38/TMEM64 family)